MTLGLDRPVQERVTPKIAPTASAGSLVRTQITDSIAKLTAIAVAKKVTVATRLANEPIEVPLRPLPDVQPPASFAPKPISTPATTRIGATRKRLSPVNVVVSQP